MKKKSIMRILTGTLCLAMLLSATAFASSGSLPLTKVEDTVKTEEAQHKGEYIIKTGVITSSEAENDYYRIEAANDQGGIVFLVKEGVFVIDQKTGNQIAVKDLKKDMEIAAVLPVNSPMTMSLPPQTSAAVAFVVKSEGSSIDVAIYNDELTNESNTLKLNVSEKTRIIDTKGSKKIFTAEDIKGNECIVLYTAATRSIPAQTNPETVIILEKTEVQDEAAAGANQKGTSESQYVELRAAVEDKGYKLEWVSNKKPIVLTKNDMKIELNIGSEEFTFTHMTRDIKPLDRMSKLDKPVVLESGKTMIPASFIDALE